MDPNEPATVLREGTVRRVGLPIGDMRGYGRVGDDASLVSLALDRNRGPIACADPARPLLSLDMGADVQWTRAYVPGTNVLETTARADGAEVRVVDFMALAEGRPGQAEAVPRGEYFRIVTCTEGEASFRVVCTASLGDREATRDAAQSGVHLASSAATTVDGDVAVANLRLAAGESAVFALADHALDGGTPLVARALHALGDTIHYWTWWSDRCRYKGDDFEAVLRDALGQKLACGAGGALMIEDDGTHGFREAPLGECARVATRFLALAYRNECVELLAHVVSHDQATPCGHWTLEPLVAATLREYVAKYGMSGLPEILRLAVPVAGDSPAKLA